MANLAHVDTTLVTSDCGYLELARGKVEFQFMPKIGSDDRSPTWKGDVIPEQAESLAIYMGGSSRQISINFTYMVVDRETRMNGWNIQKIRDQLSLIRGYVHEARLKDKARNLVGRLKLWGVGGANSISCRIEKASIKHGPQWIASDNPPRTTIPALGAKTPNGGSVPDFNNETKQQINSGAGSFPLRTDVTLDIALWTESDGRLKIAKGLDKSVTVDWY